MNKTTTTETDATLAEDAAENTGLRPGAGACWIKQRAGS